MTRKIGILTIHNALNYGSTLQALALQEYLSSLGFACRIIDYQNESINIVYGRNIRLKKLLKYLFSGKLKAAYYYICDFLLWIKTSKYANIVVPYDRFRKKNLRLTKPVFPHENPVFSDYYAFIAGSDQIWSDIVGNDTAYYLDFPNYSGLRIAYAASGKRNGTRRQMELLKQFDAISVREIGLQKDLIEAGLSDVEVVCDPTLLHEVTYWRRFLRKNKIKEKYIFAYLMWDEPAVLSYTDDLARALDLPVVVLHRASEYVLYNGKRISSATPADFLTLIANAEYVISNSFHGTIFSLLFNKPFASFNNDGRVNDLLTVLHLEDRFINRDRVSGDIFLTEIPWDDVTRKIQNFRAHSQRFLQNALDVPYSF